MGERRQDGVFSLKRHRVQQLEALWVWLKVCHTHFLRFHHRHLVALNVQRMDDEEKSQSVLPFAEVAHGICSRGACHDETDSAEVITGILQHSCSAEFDGF